MHVVRLNDSRWIVWGALLAGVAVIMGAFGAHFMEDHLASLDNGDRRMEVWKTAAQYHIVHAIGLILVGLTPTTRTKLMATSAILLTAGILVFSGLLYAYSFTDLRILGAFVPIGGVSMIAGWVVYAIAACGRPTRNDHLPSNQRDENSA
jgi:uncharacterized membrane protein YgdD (TMEM256/DUF423 family)